MRSILVWVVLAGCGTDLRDDSAPPQPAPRATWYQDVAPIVAEHCTGCHHSGGIGPFELTSYDAAADNAMRALDKIEKGEMPPFDAREDADCTPRFSWVDDPRLSTSEIETIRAWIEDGLAEGTPTPIPPPPSLGLTGANRTLTPAVPFTPSGPRDQFVCYVLDPQLPQGAWLTGLQVRPGNPLVVHHVVITELMPGPEHDAIVAERGIGMPWDCDQSTPGEFIVNVWTPGSAPMQTSPELAVPILGGAKLVMNIHYHPANMIHQPDATAIDLRVSAARPRKMYFVGGFGNAFEAPDLLPDPDDRDPHAPEFRIPANAATHTEHMRITIPQLGDLQDVRLYSANPHMHLIGTQISARLERPAPRGSDPQHECLANGGWNFDWQRTYIYDAPLDQLPSIAAGDVIDIRCTWNNTLANPFVQRALADAGLVAPIDVHLGEGSLDEMCLEIFGLAIDVPAGANARGVPTVDRMPIELLDAMRLTR